MKIESSVNKVRSTISSLVFGTQVNKATSQVDHGKPLVIPAGSDSLQNIGKNLQPAISPKKQTNS